MAIDQHNAAGRSAVAYSNEISDAEVSVAGLSPGVQITRTVYGYGILKPADAQASFGSPGVAAPETCQASCAYSTSTVGLGPDGTDKIKELIRWGFGARTRMVVRIYDRRSQKRTGESRRHGPARKGGPSRTCRGRALNLERARGILLILARCCDRRAFASADEGFGMHRC